MQALQQAKGEKGKARDNRTGNRENDGRWLASRQARECRCPDERCEEAEQCDEGDARFVAAAPAGGEQESYRGGANSEAEYTRAR